MATAQAIVPILATNFANNAHHHVAPIPSVAASPPPPPRPAPPPSPASPSSTRKSPSGRPSPSRTRDSPARRRAEDSPARRKRDGTTSSASSVKSNDIFSLTDIALAEKYQFVEEIGYGNWGSVWKCRPKASADPEAKIAVKLVHRSKNPTSSARVRSLWTEFKCIRALRPDSHPNVITFHSFIITASYALISMDHHPRLMPVELPEVKAKDYFRQLVDAVAFLHREGCSHNDIKPANILLSSSDSPVLVDFGFAQQYTLSSTDQFLSSLSWGTPEYLSPERARGILHDERLSDIWALGVTMYEIVVGRTPFEKNDAEEFLTRDALEVYYHRTTSGNFFGEYKISQELESLVHHMVEPNVSLRIQSCGKALKHRFFDPPLPLMRNKASTSSSFDSSSRFTATPPRSGSVPTTPRSSAHKAHRNANTNSIHTPSKLVKTDERKKQFKVFDDAATTSPSPVRPRTTSKPTPTRVLTERNSFVSVKSPSKPPPPPLPSSPSPAAIPTSPPPAVHPKVHATPSKIPVRKVDISSPIALQRPTPRKAAPPTRITVPTLTAAEKAAIILEQGPVRPQKSPAREIVVTPVREVVKLEDRVEVLSTAEKKVEKSPTSPRLFGSWSRPATPGEISFSSNPSTPLRSKFFNKVSPVENAPADGVPNQFEDITSGQFAAFARPRPSLGQKIRKLSLRRAPSTLSFRGMNSPFSSVGNRRRASTSAGFSFTMIDKPSADVKDRGDMTMPITMRHEEPSLDMNGERAKLESFSRHIQDIIDARKSSEIPRPRKSVSTAVMAAVDEGPTEAILSPSEVQEFRQQVAEELARERSKKSLSTELFNAGPVGPRAIRSGSVSRASPAASTNAERPSFKIRPSLTPSFVDGSASASPTLTSFPTSSTSSSPADSELVRVADSSMSTVSSFTSSAVDEFKPGHRRIPTAIRNVPSILLTESADEGSESDCSRSETPCSERALSPPPAPRLVEPGRQLPTCRPSSSFHLSPVLTHTLKGVPEEISDNDEDDGDVDEPTITISTPNKLKRKPSKTPTPTPSSNGLFQQFVRATPGVERRVRTTSAMSRAEADAMAPPFTTNVIPMEEYEQERSMSRATYQSQATDDTGKRSRRQSLMSFFSRSTNRPPTPTPSMSSMRSASTTSLMTESDDGLAKVRKAGKLRRALKKLF
ncbi:hypothetical protein MNV49_000080 [Pseudohyphozyma bogoriensis]|nr:hypothetical protein MNV49_000080 [Pseudohyphozyma bogoriensis]